MRSAKLFELGLQDRAIIVDTASLFISNLIDNRRCVDGLAVAIHTGQNAAPAAPGPAYDAVVAARAALFGAVGTLLDSVRDGVLADAATCLRTCDKNDFFSLFLLIFTLHSGLPDT